MALSIKNEEADRLARELARHTGETLTEAVVTALRERLQRLRPPARNSLVEDIERIGRRNQARKLRDTRSAEDILGYDEHGLPT